jgi:hypothetical protein
MGRIQEVLKHYADPDASATGRRQVNARLLVEDFAKLEVLCGVYKATKSRLATDLLTAAVEEAWESFTFGMTDHELARFEHEAREITDNLFRQEAEAR